MTFEQTYPLDNEYGFGSQSILFRISDTYEHLFLENTDSAFFDSGERIDCFPANCFEIEGSKKEFETENGAFKVDEMNFTMDAAACVDDIDKNALYFTLEARSIAKSRFCAVFINPDYTSEETLISSIDFIGKVNTKVSGDDIKHNRQQYNTLLNPLRDYKATAYSFDVTMLERCKNTEEILLPDGTTTDSVYTRINRRFKVAEWNSGTTYYKNDIVSDGASTLTYYRSIYDGHSNMAVTNTTYWEEYDSDFIIDEIFKPRLYGAVNATELSNLMGTGMRYFYFYHLGNLYKIIRMYLDVASEILEELIGTKLTITLSQNSLGVQTAPTVIDKDSIKNPEVNPYQANLNHLEELVLNELDVPGMHKSVPWIHRRMVDNEFATPNSLSDVQEQIINNEKTYSFKNLDNIAEILFEIARCFGCFIFATYTSTTGINIKIVPRQNIVNDDSVYIIDAEKAQLDQDTVDSGETNYYYSRANNLAWEGKDFIDRRKWEDENGSGDPTATSEKEMDAIDELKDNSQEVKRLFLSTGLTKEHNYHYFQSSQFINYTLLMNSLITDVDESVSGIEESDFFDYGKGSNIAFERLHSAIYVRHEPLSSEQAGYLGSASVWSPAQGIWGLINNEVVAKATLSEYINALLAYNIQFYENGYEWTIPFLNGFSLSPTDHSDASWKNLVLGNKAPLKEKYRQYNETSGQWEEITPDEATQFVVISIERKYADLSTNLKLHALGQFIYGMAYDMDKTGDAPLSFPSTESYSPVYVPDGARLYTYDDDIDFYDAVMVKPNGRVIKTESLQAYYGLTVGIAMVSGEQDDELPVQIEGRVENSLWSFDLTKPVFARTNASGTNITQEVLSEPSSTEDLMIELGWPDTETSFILNKQEYILDF